MDFSGHKYYELNRMLLLSIGLWPYDDSTFKRVIMLISLSFIISGITIMITKMITSKFEVVLILRVLSIFIPICIVLIKYITFLILPTSIKRLMELVQNDWNTLKDVNELEIIKKYANFGRFCTITFL
ncbi:PREDICTED: uncharacterized protein LOC105562604, partial [Vollenhovia emeryi]|uniref:uncharacterized protein LOC105562604 n=1 Tax=Vollenhovia emeryi TaxID=411798 RepID=UPI0005F55B42